jgi:hypothetical protein
MACKKRGAFDPIPFDNWIAGEITFVDFNDDGEQIERTTTGLLIADIAPHVIGALMDHIEKFELPQPPSETAE